MKSCKGCWYLDKSLFGPYCMVYGSWEEKYNPITEKTSLKRVNHRKASDMRTIAGDCGPDRKLYITFWRLLWNAIKNRGRLPSP
ncbi:MAG: hypothetical protein GY814_17955 [Gammaproteobacteria bacterium]|nr:hypothetical protein [Gammaproteobacteria bacterium]